MAATLYGVSSRLRIWVIGPEDCTNSLLEMLDSVGDVTTSGASDSIRNHFLLGEDRVVVVLCADTKEAAQKAKTIHAVKHRMILIGQVDGPVRTALDAAPWKVEHFISRPVSVKALLFAVAACADGYKGANTLDNVISQAIDDVILEGIEGLMDSSADDGENLAVEVSHEENNLRLEDENPVYVHRVEQTAVYKRQPIVSRTRSPTMSAPEWRDPTLVLRESATSHPRISQQPGEHSVDTPREDDSQAIGARDSNTQQYTSTNRLSGYDSGHSYDGHAGDSIADGSAQGLGAALRRRMSKMAERLFPSQESPSVDVSYGPQSEIDLRYLGGEAEKSSAPDMVPVVVTHRTDTKTSHAQEQGLLDRGTMDVAYLLADLYRSGFSGVATFRQDVAEKKLYFADGATVFASSNLPHDRLGDLLYREARLSGKQHAEAREESVRSGRRIGEVMVEKGFLQKRDLMPAIRRHVDEILYSLFSWQSGEYILQEGNEAKGEPIRAYRHPTATIVEGVRRKYSLVELSEYIGDENTVLQIVDTTALVPVFEHAELTKKERNALEGMKDGATVSELVATTGIDTTSLLSLSYALRTLGILGTRNNAAVVATHSSQDTAVAVRDKILARHEYLLREDYFCCLNVSAKASGFDIKQAYQRALLEYQATNFEPEVQAQLKKELTEIAAVTEEAYWVLIDDKLRADYRSGLDRPCGDS